jgi:hypothetical protein
MLNLEFNPSFPDRTLWQGSSPTIRSPGGGRGAKELREIKGNESKYLQMKEKTKVYHGRGEKKFMKEREGIFFSDLKSVRYLVK